MRSPKKEKKTKVAKQWESSLISRKPMTLYPEGYNKENKKCCYTERHHQYHKQHASKFTPAHEDTENKIYRGLVQGTVLSHNYLTYASIALW